MSIAGSLVEVDLLVELVWRKKDERGREREGEGLAVDLVEEGVAEEEEVEVVEGMREEEEEVRDELDMTGSEEREELLRVGSVGLETGGAEEGIVEGLRVGAGSVGQSLNGQGDRGGHTIGAGRVREANRRRALAGNKHFVSSWVASLNGHRK